MPVGTTLDDAKRFLILKTLEMTRNNKTRAADLLGISAKTLYNKLSEWGIPYSGESSPPVGRYDESNAAVA